MRSIIKYLLQGLLIVAPMGITVYVIYESFLVLDGLITFETPGLGILVVLVGITLIGFVASHLISERLKFWMDRQIRKAPVISLIYTAVTDVLNALVGEKRSFKYPVLVQLDNDPAVKRIGFVTHRGFGKQAELEEDYLTVYCPHSYAISGNVFLVAKERVENLDLPAADVMKYVISGGVTRIQDESKKDQ
ncbi:DUF502 domain-containing protein [Croceimicrobium hydrocarbonivorans]|uniref:DUF502 domain-containing protein n=1 Tax=Croceimicrobium hydrocarbonivorans TaxID=2761580 RepID=A0A7H0VAT9_9FLAO|nr:DUF502 domain-containing protein [Croceimicrobium hydrocarbonivorans]QNR22837.1 DUF502 domain-containing protein [Croceimicrobium hydrocarbonivorans]